MRKYKFRGKTNDGKWMYGCYILNRGAHFIADDSLAKPNATWKDFEVIPETVGQFTGLFDKNGKEIYEGDIVKLTQLHYEVTGKIVYINTEFALYVPEEDSTYDFFPPDRTSEVIGNIHDNSDLLNK